MTTTQNKVEKAKFNPAIDPVHLVSDESGEPRVLVTPDGKPRKFKNRKEAWKWVKINIKSPKRRKHIFIVPTR